MKVSLLVSVWKRQKNLPEFFERWLKEPEVDEVLVWDNSNGELEIPKHDKIRVFRSPLNYGCTARNILVHFARNDTVIVSCDDVFIEKGFIADLFKYYEEDMMLGIWGRIFNSDYLNSSTFTSIGIDEPKYVDFVVGLIYMMERKYLLPLDYRDMEWTCDDLCINGELKVKFPQVRRLIVPNNKWKLTEDEVDEFALYRHPDALIEKTATMERYFK